MVGMARGAVLSTYLSSWDLATEGSPGMENGTFRNNSSPGYHLHHQPVSGLGVFRAGAGVGERGQKGFVKTSQNKVSR